MVEAANDADQSLWAQRHGPAGAQFLEDKHASVPVQVRRRRRRRYVEEGDDPVVSVTRASRHATQFVASGFLVACATMSGGSSGVTSSASRNSSWVDSAMATLSPRDRAAQLVWP